MVRMTITIDGEPRSARARGDSTCRLLWSSRWNQCPWKVFKMIRATQDARRDSSLKTDHRRVTAPLPALGIVCQNVDVRRLGHSQVGQPRDHRVVAESRRHAIHSLQRYSGPREIRSRRAVCEWRAFRRGNTSAVCCAKLRQFFLLAPRGNFRGIGSFRGLRAARDALRPRAACSAMKTSWSRAQLQR